MSTLDVEGAAVLAAPSIRRRFLGGTAELSFGEWAAWVIQDEEEALAIARRMLDDITSAYPFNTPATGAEPEFYEEFDVIAESTLRAQMVHASFARGKGQG